MPTLRMVSVQSYPTARLVDRDVFFIVRIHMDEPPFKRESSKLYDWRVAQHLKKACRLRQAELEKSWFDEASFDTLMTEMENASEESVQEAHWIDEERLNDEGVSKAGPDE